MSGLEGKIAVVTGGGRGIGAATAEMLAGKGASVVIASRSMEELKEVSQKSTNIYPMQTDIGIEKDIDNLFAFVMAKWGTLDILVNAAAIVGQGAFTEISYSQWRKVLDINVLGSAFSCRHAFRMMKGSGGSIVNISSLAGIQNIEKFSGLSAYTTSKFAITGLTEALAVEGKPYNIRVNALAFGPVETKMLRDAAPFLKTNMTAEDAAKLICFLANNEESGKLSGSIIPVFSRE